MNTILSFSFILVSSTLVAQTFTGSFEMIVTQQYANGNGRNDTVSYFFEEDRQAIIIHGRRNDPDMRMLFNSTDTTITNLYEMNGRKSGYILPMDEEHWPGMEQAFRPNSTGSTEPLNYTGNEKEIEGHTCKEVLAENDDYTATLWVAEDIPLSMTRVLSYQSVGKGKSKKEIELFDQLGVKSLPLEMELVSNADHADVTIRLINFSDTVDGSVFNTEGHNPSKVTR